MAKTHPWTCPQCGATCTHTAAWAARLRQPCRACVRTANGWSCLECGSADPHHPIPCPSQFQTGDTVRVGNGRTTYTVDRRVPEDDGRICLTSNITGTVRWVHPDRLRKA